MPLKIYAEEYTDWTDQYDNTYKESETQIRYKWFLVQKEGGYYPLNKAPAQYYLTEGDKVGQGPYSSWQYNCRMLSKNTYDIEYKEFYGYKKIEPARYIILYHQKENFTFTNIKVYIKGQEINYNIIKCPSCSEGKYNLNTNDSIVIDMLAFYELEDITLLLETNRPNEPLTYGISISMDSNRKKQCANYTGETHIKNYKIDEKWLARRRTTDILPSETPITQTIFVDNYGLHNFCRYREYYKYYYYIKHIFYDDNYYASSPKEGYSPDVSDIKTYYRYKLSSKKTPEELDQENKKDDNKNDEKNNDKKEDKEDTSQENNNNNNIPPTPNKDNDHYQSNSPTIAPSTEITSSLIPINNVPLSPILTEQINTKNTSSNNKPTILFPLFLVTLIVLNIILFKTQKNVERIN